MMYVDADVYIDLEEYWDEVCKELSQCGVNEANEACEALLKNTNASECFNKLSAQNLDFIYAPNKKYALDRLAEMGILERLRELLKEDL